MSIDGCSNGGMQIVAVVLDMSVLSALPTHTLLSSRPCLATHITQHVAPCGYFSAPYRHKFGCCLTQKKPQIPLFNCCVLLQITVDEVRKCFTCTWIGVKLGLFRKDRMFWLQCSYLVTTIKYFREVFAEPVMAWKLL